MSAPEAVGSPRIRRIAVATDGSKDALRATEVALDLAKRTGAELFLVSAVPYAVGVGGGSADTWAGARAAEEYADFARAEARKVLREAAALARAEGVPAQEALLDRAASAVEMIAEFAKAEKIDLIVTGTRGLSGLRKLVLGSVSTGLVNQAPCSVLVVR